MAKLTDQLSTDLAVKPVREPPAPSTGLATLFNNAAGMINTVQTTERRYQEEQRQKAASDRQAREDAYKAQERRLPLEIVQGVERARGVASQVFNEPAGLPKSDDPETRALQDQFDQTFTKLSSQQAAARQGKLPDVAFRAALNKEYAALVNAHPDHVGQINEEFKKYGFQPSTALQAAQDLQSQHDAVREAGEKFQEDMFKTGASVLTAEQLSGMSRDEVIVHGINNTRAQTEISLAKQQADLILQQKNISEADRRLTEDSRDDSISQTLIVNALNDFNPVRTALQQAMTAIGKAPVGEQQALFEQYGVKLDQMLGNYKAQLIARAAAAGMSPEKINSLTTTFEGQVDSLRGMWSGDLSVAKSNQSALDALVRASKVDAAKALPAFFALKNAGLQPTELQAFAEGVASNAKLQADLRKELEGYSTEFGREKASTRLMNIVRILKGETGLQDYTPEQARNMLPSLYRTSQQLARDYNLGKTDVGAGTLLNSIGGVITAARTLTPSSGMQAWMTATSGVAGRDVRQAAIKALRDPVNNDLAEATVQGLRASSAQILDSMRGEFSKQGAGRFDQWRPVLKDGRAVLERKQIPLGGYERGHGGASQVKMGFGTQPPPQELTNFVNIWNSNIDNIIALNPHDPTGVKNATPLDIAKFYGQNIVTEPFKTRPEINPRNEIDKQFEELDKIFDRVPEMNTTVVTPKTNVMNYEARAAGFEQVPSSVKTLGDASEFAKSVNAAGVKSSAMGTYQIVGQTLRNYAPKVFGSDWKSVAFTHDAQEKIAEAIFNDHNHSAKALRDQWVSLTLQEAERVRRLPWAQARAIIAEGESG